MKANNILVILSAFVLLFLIFGKGDYTLNKQITHNVYEVMANEGVIAHYATTVETTDVDVKKYDCENCKDKKFIRSGDGLIEVPCPECNPQETVVTGCQCGCGDVNCVCSTGAVGCIMKQDTTPVVTKAPPVQFLYFTAQWCQYCTIFDNTQGKPLIDAGWGVNYDEVSLIRKVDTDQQPFIYEKYGKGRGLPLFVLLKNGVEIGAVNGNSVTHKQLTDMYMKAIK